MLTSLYIHVPFCNQICTYCDFHKEIAKDSKKTRYIYSLREELKHNKDLYSELETVYIGGGTPSSLDLNLLEILLKTINDLIDINRIKEFTIETNPNDISIQFIKLIKKYNINRVSVGIQTFSDKHLNFLGRTHSKTDIYHCINLLKEYNIPNISVDMIFSLINQTVEELVADINEVIKLDVNHISFYSLILEEKTKLYYLYENNKISMNSEDLEGVMYNKVINTLTDNNYLHYEISNFAKPGFESLHNKTYWLNREYLGLGSGAHSQYQNKRLYNPHNVTQYIEKIENNDFSFQTEYEYGGLEDEMMLGLRLLKGINIDYINNKYNIDLLLKYPELNEFIAKSILVIDNGYLHFTREGILLGNEVFKIFVEVL